MQIAWRFHRVGLANAELARAIPVMGEGIGVNDPADFLGSIDTEGKDRTPQRKHSPSFGDTQRDLRYDALMREYARSNDVVDLQLDRTLRIGAIGFAAAGALLILVTEGRLVIGEWALWLGPILLTFFCNSMIFFGYRGAFYVYYARDLEDDIADITGIPYFHIENAYDRGVASFRSGYLPALVSQVMLVVFIAGMYLTVLVIGATQMLRDPNVPAWRGWLYISLQLTLALTLLWSAIGVWAALRKRYDDWRFVAARDSKVGISESRGPHILEIVAYALLPRAFEFFNKGFITLAALVVTALILDVGSWGEVLTLGLLVVFCIDFLAKQSTYIWNDILDVQADRAHSYKSKRLLSRLNSPGFGKALFLSRAAMAMGVAVFVGFHFNMWWLPAIILFIFAWQFVYDRYGKRDPRSRLIVTAIGYGERGAAGSLTALYVADSVDLLLVTLISTWVVAYNCMMLAAYWRAERAHQLSEVHGRDADPGKIWFLSRPASLAEGAANVMLLPVGLVLAYIYTNVPREKLPELANLVRMGGQFGLSKITSDLLSIKVSTVFDDPFSGSDPMFRHFAISVGVLSLAGALIVTIIRWKVRTKVEQQTSDHPFNRGPWTVGTIIFLLAAWILVPLKPWLFAVAFAAPIFLAAATTALSFDEFTGPEKRLHSAIRRFLPFLDHLLFQPWAVRLSIRPVNVTTENAVASEEWAEALRRMYTAWATKKNGLDSRKKNGRDLRKLIGIEDRSGEDGGGQYDLLLTTTPFSWWGAESGLLQTIQLWTKLPTESGVHRLYIDPGSSDVDPLRCEVNVVVQRLAAPTSVRSGGGLDVPSMDSDSKDAERGILARSYFVDRVPCTGSWPQCQAVFDTRTGIWSDEPRTVLDGKIDPFLQSDKKNLLSLSAAEHDANIEVAAEWAQARFLRTLETLADLRSAGPVHVGQAGQVIVGARKVNVGQATSEGGVSPE